MLSNEHKIKIRSKEKASNIQIFQSEFCDQPLPIKYLKKPFKRSKQIFSTQPVSRKNILESEQRKYHIKSGFNIHRKYLSKDDHSPKSKDEIQTDGSIFSRRVNSQTKASKTKLQIENKLDEGAKSQIKINFAKKIIEDLKKQTFKMRKSNPRYSASKLISKSVELSKKQLMNREKILQNSIQKLRPSFNINEVKILSSKRSLSKNKNGSQTESNSNLNKKKKQNISNLEDKISESIGKVFGLSEEILAKTLKKLSLPLNSYNEFIKNQGESQYKIRLNFLDQYISLAEKEGVIAHIDFSSMKLLSSIYLCLIDIFSHSVTETNQKMEHAFNYELVRQYMGVYFQTYSKIKTEYILCQVLFKSAKKKLAQFFLLQRAILYGIVQLCSEQKITEHANDVKKIINFLKLSQEMMTSIMNDQLSKKQPKDSFIDTFKSLRLTRQLDKRLPSLKEVIQSMQFIFFESRSSFKKFAGSESFADLYGSLMELLKSSENQENFDVITIFKLQQYFNWTILNIPPLFYLPTPSLKPYTLVIDLDGTLIFYNQETRILKYRPYMDRFLQAMQKHYELIIFSSYPKQRSDIIINEIQRGEQIFSYRLYKSHMVFQEGVLRKNVGYLGRNLQKLVFIDDEEKNTQWLPSNSFKIKLFTGDKQDKQLLSLSDWLTGMIEAQPTDVRGKIKKPQTSLDQIAEIDEISSTIQASIQYLDGNQVFVHRKN